MRRVADATVCCHGWRGRLGVFSNNKRVRGSTGNNQFALAAGLPLGFGRTFGGGLVCASAATGSKPT